MKIYQVKVGNYSNKANFIPAIEFVAQSQMDLNDINRYLINKYKPLSVQVSEIQTIEKIDEVEKQPNQNIINSQFLDFKVKKESFNQETLNAFRNFYDSREKTENLKRELHKQIESQFLKPKLEGIYSEVEIGSTEYHYYTVNLKVKLKGSLTEFLKP